MCIRDRFRAVVERVRAQGFDPGTIHFANSSAFYKLDHFDFGDAVRIGSAFTGRLAFPCKDTGLLRVGYLESQVCEIRWISRGATVGYGGVYRAKSPRKIAIVPLGYSHGFATEKVREDVYKRQELNSAEYLPHTVFHSPQTRERLQ